MIKKIEKKYKMVVFCFILALVSLLICSESSPLYPLNDWFDANIYFTVGKGMVNGFVPYLDLFDHKGPIIYLIYGIGSLISSSSFIGVFILEVISFTIFLYYIYKIIVVFCKEKFSYIILPVFTCLIVTSTAFVQGSSVEEFAFPLLSCGLYYLIEYYKKQELSRIVYFVQGLFAGIILVLKFNLLGFWFGFMFFILIDLCLQEKFKDAIFNSLIFLSGMILPFAFFSIYFLINGAFDEFIYTYFGLNLFGYANEDISLIQMLKTGLVNFIDSLLNNSLILFILFIGVFVFILNSSLKRRYKIMLSLTIIIMILGIFGGGRVYNYYLLFLLPLIIFSLIGIAKYYKKVIDRGFNSKFKIILLVVFYISILLLTLYGANFRQNVFKPKSEMIQYKLANIINKEEDKSILNFGLDLGVYFATDTIPNVKYYFLTNFDPNVFSDNLNSQKEYIMKGKTNFIVTISNNAFDDEINKKYKLIYQDQVVIEDFPYDVKLYKRVSK